MLRENTFPIIDTYSPTTKRYLKN